MLTPRELELLDVVGEVMRERLAEVRLDYECQLGEVRAKVAALESRDEPWVTREAMALFGADLQAINVKRIAEIPPPPDLTPLTAKLTELDGKTEVLQTFTVDIRHEISAASALQIAAMDQRFNALPPPVDLAPLEQKIAELETRPTDEDVLTLASSALGSTRASMIGELHTVIDQHFAALPIPEKGDPGAPGKDGSSVTAEDFRPMFEAAYAKHELETERRIMDLVQRTLDRIPIPKDGKDGKDGADGFGFDDFTPVFDGERTLTLRFVQGERVKEFPLVLPYPLDDGVWKPDIKYVRGDGVSWNGSFWIAQRDNPDKPNEGDSGWRLAVKKARDGKDGERGLKGDPGTPGKNGRDLRYRMDGSASP